MTIFKVMTWNVENLFLFGHRSSPKTPEEYQQKLTSLAQVILNLEPHVVALQEIGHVEALEELVALLKGRYPHRLVSSSPDPRGIRVGFISQLEIEEHEDISTFPQEGLSKVVGWTNPNITEITRMSRGALRIRVRPKPELPIHLLNAHFKSKLLTFTSSTGQPRFTPRDENERAQGAGLALLKRTAESVALRVRASALLENNTSESLIVLGDLNDVPSAATTQILHGPGGSEIGTLGFNRRDKGDDTRLFNLASLIPEQRRYSRIYQNNKELIDHILVSQELLPGQPRKLPKVDSHVDFAEGLPSVSDLPHLRPGKPGSDHAPITAIFEL
jgi:endonuclease/exonuclease/phosphatase family metal-dependent hydrolase